jgi:hypothetical protein
MKKLVICITMMLSLSFGIQAQSVIKEGNTFKSITSSKAKADTLLTAYKFEDSKGIQYPIIINKTSGRCWIWKKSGKTGKMYKQYLNEEISKAVCRELGITYVPKTRK